MIKSIADINKIRERKQADLMIRVNPDASPTKEGGKMHIMVCGGTGCTSSNSMKIIEGLESLIKINQLEDASRSSKQDASGSAQKALS